MKKIGFYAYDVGPGNMLKLIAEAAAKMGHEVVVLPPQVRGVSAERGKEMADCNVVLIGLSSFQTQEEIALLDQLLPLGIPVVVIEDVPGTCLRPMAKDYAPKISCAIVSMPFAETDARSFGYKNVVYLGPPHHWGKAFKDIELTLAIRDSIRGRLTAIDGELGVVRPIIYSDAIIYCPGGKNAVFVNKILRLVIEAGKKALGDRLVFAFRGHPGEKAEKEADKQLFQQMFAEREIMLKEVTHLQNADFNNAQLIAASDLTIYTGGMTDSINSAYARLASIQWYDDETRASLQKQGILSGKWFVGELDGARQVTSPGEMTDAIKTLLTPQGQEELHRHQEQNFPLPVTWDTAPEIVRFLEKY